MEKLGVRPSLSRPSVSNDNAYAEALFRTMKYVPHYPKGSFESLDAARDWVMQFVGWYNHSHKYSGIEFVSPVQRHDGAHLEVLAERKRVYEEAKAKNPSRWARGTRNWSPSEVVWLNNPTAHTGSAKDQVA